MNKGQSRLQDNHSKEKIMKQTYTGKVYDTDKMETLATKNLYNNGNYAGDVQIMVTRHGKYALVTRSNGQDSFLSSSISPIEKEDIAEAIDGWELNDDEAARLIEHGLIIEA